MRFKLTLFPLLFLSVQTYALPNKINCPPPLNWIAGLITEESSATQTGFIQLQEKYPDLFFQFDPQSVISAHVNTTVLEYIGPTTCPDGDPRLKFISQSFGLCEAGSNSCFQSSSSFPGDTDPCDNSVPERRSK